jgi:hypothetical protein
MTASREVGKTKRKVTGSTPGYTLILRGRHSQIKIEGVTDNKLYPLACWWNDIVGNRQRMGRKAEAKLKEEAVQQFVKLAFHSHMSQLEVIAAWDVIEVEIPWRSENVGWAARVFPWEDVLSMATKPYRGSRCVTVVRYLNIKKAGTPPPLDSLQRLLVISSDPGEIKRHYVFDDECDRVKAMFGKEAWGGIESGVVRLESPPREAIKKTVKALRPQVIHAAGVDLHQARELLSMQQGEDVGSDGYLLAAKSGETGYDFASADQIASLFTAANETPTLICFNIYYSAARTAALCVAAGAHYAVGFQDTADDVQADDFFARFYANLSQNGNLLEAFQKSVDVFRGARQRGAGVVLWSRHSIVDQVVSQVETTTLPATEPRLLEKEEDIRKAIGLKIVPPRQLNYSMLHNGRPLMEEFVVSKISQHRTPPVEIEITLHAGQDDFPYRQTFELTPMHPVEDLRESIHTPRISSLLRSCRESLWSSLYVQVTSGGVTLYRNTWPIELLSADEWRNTDEDRCWLPSFVFPRDAMVEKVMAGAQIMLRVLTDRVDAGFDGYQAFDRQDNDARLQVDMQVRAIWAALQHLFPLAYINPPPSYDPWGQRIRTPSQMFEAQAGTCIDISMLFCACLENVCLYPAVFLIEGHAFPGYWRDPVEWEKFAQFAQQKNGETDAVARDRARTTSVLTERQSGAGWMFEKNFLPRIKRHIQKGALVPFESTLATSKRPFEEALEAGLENLADESIFLNLVDIQISRTVDHPVTPLPLASSFFNAKP